MEEPIIEAIALTKNFGQKNQYSVLKNISLKIYKGEFIAITGASGSGKSTLLNILSGLDSPSSGEIRYHGKTISSFSDNALSNFRNQTIGFIFQSYNLQPFLSVYDNIAIPAYLKNSKRAQIESKVDSLLKIMRLEDKRDHQISELSGGQCQRVAIARALINNPSVIFADEPTGNLDSKSTENIISLLKHINRNLKITVILVTHEESIAKISDRHIIIKDGELV
jgi:hypothetical protein ELI_4481